jgi:hypothetical protein
MRRKKRMKEEEGMKEEGVKRRKECKLTCKPKHKPCLHLEPMPNK